MVGQAYTLGAAPSTAAAPLFPEPAMVAGVEPVMPDDRLTDEEFAALVAIDSSIGQRRPSMDIEIKLRRLGLIERNGLSRLPARTAKGNALVAGRRGR
jgi:hypothetical protein